ncbi:hypothetical protein LA080_011843 [Diaporthe eres]|nr:hypothetical protein LA080_011843 [Diaporthe eres]
MNILYASNFTEAPLYDADAVSIMDSSQPATTPSIIHVDNVDGDDHPPCRSSDAEFDLASAEYGLWLPDRHDRFLSEVIAMSHDELLALALAEMAPEKGTDANPIDLTKDIARLIPDDLESLSCATLDSGNSCHRSNLPTTAGKQQAQLYRPPSTNSLFSPPSLRASPDSPIPQGEKRKACSVKFSGTSKRAKAKQSSAMRPHAASSRPSARYLHEEKVFLRLEKIFVTFGRQRDECHWKKRLASWSSGTHNFADIRWMFEEHSDAVSVQVRPDGVGHLVEMAWEGEGQCFIGKTLDEKWIEVSSEVMLAMHDNPLDGQFVGSRWDWRRSGKCARNGD